MVSFSPSRRSKAISGETLLSSFTDNGIFPVSCREIANDQRRFEEFRCEPVIVRAMEHVSFAVGQAHLDSILSCCPGERESYLGVARKNDAVGAPATYDYAPYGFFSPKTLEYIRIAHDLRHIFGDLSGREIFEIGGGYGGQALVLTSLFDLPGYTILDLPDVLDLQRRYHTAHGVSNVSYLSATDQARSVVARHSQLLISNFAFMECRKEVQKAYLTHIISHAERGYMACNFVMKSRKSLPLIGKYALLRSVKGSYYVDERPELYVENRILLWDRSSAGRRHSLIRSTFSEFERDFRVLRKRLSSAASPRRRSGGPARSA